MKLNIDNCCLLIIDLQEKLLPHIFNEEKIKVNVDNKKFFNCIIILIKHFKFQM